MTIQFNFSNTKPTQIELHSKELEDKRLEIKAAGFELLELWHTDGVHTNEVWKNPKTLETLGFPTVTLKECPNCRIQTPPQTDVLRDLVQTLYSIP